jgi:adenosylcobinamide amidohydrolase
MTRRPRDLTFRKTDCVRAYRAAITAGIPNPRIEISRHGTISIIAGESKSDTATDNPWDKVLTNAANEKRPA